MVELKAMNSQFRYFPVDSSLLDWALRVTCGGRASYSPGAEFPLHAHPDEYFFSWDVGRRLGDEEERSARASSVRADMVLRAQAHIAEHATEIVDFEQLSNMLGVPYRTLRHAFSKEARVSPLQYQLSIRLARAMNMLRSSDMPISEMSHKLGFNSVWHFSHFFRDRVGQSPAAYRNSANSSALPRKVEKLKILFG